MHFPRVVTSCGSFTTPDHNNYNPSLQIPHGLNHGGDNLSAVGEKYKKNIQALVPSQSQVTPHFHQFPKEQWVGGGREMGLEMKRFVHGGSVALRCSSFKEIHSLSERVRRTEMNQLFAEMNSLLPSSAVKRSKACIVSDIVDYIQYLQHQLALHSSQNGGPKLPLKTGSRSPRLKNESIPEMEAPSSDCGKSDSMPSSNTKSVNENLNVFYNGKDIFITMKCVMKVNVLTSLIYAVESHNIQVINGFVSTTDTVAFHCLHAKVTDILTPEAKETLYGNLMKLMKSEFMISLKSE
ncbi:hypothetical protein SUGI_0415980 [Cryptomeria japonica]|uniref:anthocyanin regulatory R-S protein n=1 Tax=Cryptomeria japonica TaxID=3369 RepID=UPI002408D3EF|nr:anthocyanin regulatory R-S protein [Cryptomeria japonica]GLJ22149.1 hypothetical protein SUGI_0415980 [Cryptomeria japonica]